MANFIDYYEYSKLATAAYVDLNVFDGESIAAALKKDGSWCSGLYTYHDNDNLLSY